MPSVDTIEYICSLYYTVRGLCVIDEVPDINPLPLSESLCLVVLRDLIGCMVDEKIYVRLSIWLHYFRFVVGCCVLSVHFIILATPKKRSDFPVALLGVISFPCVVDVCYLFPKTKNTVRGLWVPSVDAIVDRRNCFL